MSEAYFTTLRNELQRAYAVASEARKKGLDPADEIEVKIAKDVAARVEGIVGPPGITEVIRDLEKAGMAREDIAFEVAKKIACGDLMKGNKEQLIEQAVRTGLGILTEGVLVAPTEGIAKIRIKANPDGSDYVAVYYAGPIRSAGGTAAAMSLLLADVARRICGVGDYRATDSQVARIYEEIITYETRCVHLQYLPSEDDIRVISANVPVCVDGEPTEEVEISAYRDVPGIETNRVRSGVALVICDGIALKASKLFKYTKKLRLGWDWMEKIIKVKKKEDKVEVKPDHTFLEGLVAGRPVFAHPSTKGGFRLRYGRSKTSGLMGKNIHPATMILLENFLAYGTHMKIERPGKGCVVAAHEGIEPPVVRLKNGRVMKVRTIDEAYALKGEVDEILFLGDMLCTYGDFLKSNHPLMPSGYCEEWWEAELESRGLKPPSGRDAKPMFEFSRTHGVPLHPSWTYPWHDISAEQIHSLAAWLKTGALELNGERIREFTIPAAPAKRVLEELLVEHRLAEGKVILDSDNAFALLASLAALSGIRPDFSSFERSWSADKPPLELVNELAGVKIKPFAPTYIGGRMGRPEKAKERKMDGSPHVLFPTGSFKNRSIMKQFRTLKSREGERTINLELCRLRCRKCRRLAFYRRCDVCREIAEEEKICVKCGRAVTTEMHCDFPTQSYDRRPVDLIEIFSKLDAGGLEDLKGVKGLSNPSRIPERLEKGLMRAKNDVYVFRDGTSRFDASDVSLTHFTPKEVGIDLETARRLGYERDYLGNALESDTQLVPLKHQDIILSENAVAYFIRVAAFIDEMLVNLYGLPPFYKIRKKEDLIGHMCVGLSPHTSAGVLCRIVGFTRANVGYGHPYFHTAKRRNCFHGNETLLIKESNSFKLMSIRELVENNLGGNTEKDDFGTEYKKISGIETYSLNKKTGKFELAEISHVSRHPAPENLIRLKTKSGRSITVTADHSFPDRAGRKVKAADAIEILTPWNIADSPCPRQQTIDLLSATENPDVMIRTDEEVFEDELSSISKDLGINYKTFTNYVYRKSYPLEIVRKFNPSLLKGGKYLLGSKRDRVSLRPAVRIDEDFLVILGFYVAEGYMREKPGNNQVDIAASKTWAKKYLEEKIIRVFGLKPCISGNHVTICSSFVRELFGKLGAGNGAYEKRVPDLLYGLPAEKRNAFLRGYFSGDGSCSLQSTLEVNATSVSKRLIDGISYLLLLSGIKHSISEDDRFIRSGPVFEFYGAPKRLKSFKIRIYGEEAQNFIQKIGFLEDKQRHALELLSKWLDKKGHSRTIFEGDVFIDPIVEKKQVNSDSEYVYSLTVAPHHTLVCSGVTAFQCDGDEDCVMLLMDCLINFSKKFLDEKRGGTMDAPLVLSIEINPKEVDDESHCIEMVSRYPLEFYEAAERITPPGEIRIRTVKDVLGTPEQYELPITHPGGFLDQGNIRTAYVELESIPDKIDIQFRLQEKLRAVDKRDAAEKLILSHFIPDLYGNLRSFSRQTFRCVSCNTIFRRVPLAGKCSRCGGNLLLTINKGGIEKYLEISRQICDRYDLPAYLKQRLTLVEREIKSIFEDDKIKQMGLRDFL